jgi:excinuclease UvrABC ATPase subunit
MSIGDAVDYYKTKNYGHKGEASREKIFKEINERFLNFLVSVGLDYSSLPALLKRYRSNWVPIAKLATQV